VQGDKLTLGAVGDCQITTRHSQCKNPRFLELIEILRNVDVAYANMEQCIHNLGPNCFPRAFGTHGTFTYSPPFVADEVRWMGIDMVSAATNHALDWMFGGLKETIDNLDRAGIVHAGIGMNLAEARAPSFLDSEQGRVALISVDTITPLAAAGHTRQDAPGRPGLSPVKVTRKVTLDAKNYASMREIAKILDSLGIITWREDTNEINLLSESRGYSVVVVPGEKPGVASVLEERDLKDVVQMIGDAKRQADWILVSQHHHLIDGTDRDLPSKAVEQFARTCIGAGADAYLGTGPHRIQGIEICEGKPIFYGLPDFIQTRDMGRVSPEQFYEEFGLGFHNTPMDAMDARGMRVTPPPRGSGVVVATFEKHKVVNIRLYPIDPQDKLPRWQMGRPLRADEALGQRIVENWAKLSEPYGTRIRYEKGIGIVQL
jgi:poly-gamma-glutamate capsule biosynthesis protein CapA/YwtB (metallophosphatase superfamily)